jgi:hypothetical protein
MRLGRPVGGGIGPLVPADSGVKPYKLWINSRRLALASHRERPAAKCRSSDMFGFICGWKRVVLEAFK